MRNTTLLATVHFSQCSNENMHFDVTTLMHQMLIIVNIQLRFECLDNQLRYSEYFLSQNTESEHILFCFVLNMDM